MSERVALYARVSTGEQDASGQLERLRAWADRRGFDVVEERVEEASGRDPARDGFRELVSLARGRRFDHVAVTKVDRWARSLIDLDRTVEELVECGVAFHAIDQGVKFDRWTTFGKAFVQFLGILAEMEAGLISERTKDGLEGKNPGRPAKPCSVCGREREGGVYAKVAGERRAVCASCKGLEPGERRGLWARREEVELDG